MAALKYEQAVARQDNMFIKNSNITHTNVNMITESRNHYHYFFIYKLTYLKTSHTRVLASEQEWTVWRATSETYEQNEISPLTPCWERKGRSSTDIFYVPVSLQTALTKWQHVNTPPSYFTLCSANIMFWLFGRNSSAQPFISLMAAFSFVPSKYFYT